MMKMFSGVPAFLISAAVAVTTSHAAVVALYDFEDGGSGNTFGAQAGLNSSDTELNSTATILTTGGPQGLDGGGASNIFNGGHSGSTSGAPVSNWGNGNNPEATANFAQFTTTPSAGQQIRYESLSLFHGSFNATGQIKITYAIGSGPEVVALAPLSHTAANADPLTPKSEDFSDFTTTETVTWKIHLFGADAPNTGHRLDDITINGSVTPVPEPSGFFLSMIAIAFAVFGRRR